VTLTGVIDDHMLARYRALLDAEDTAFDELEHAYEEGDRDHFQIDLEAWRCAIQAKMAYLQRMGIDVDLDTPAP
jgi:hypothetical protein